MSWPEQRVESWRHLGVIATEVAKVGPRLPSYLSRGQADAQWSLQPSLTRLLAGELDRRQALDVELRALELFRGEAHLHLPQSWLPPTLPPPALAEWWALMQHYSAPTRLLDWTYSLFVATYFAVSSHWDRDGAVFLLQGNALNKELDEHYPNKEAWLNEDFVAESATPRLIIYTPARRMDRIVAQQGTFVVSLDVLADHEATIDYVLAPMQERWKEQVLYRKLIIPHDLKPEFLLQLRQMNLAAHSLFPGADGLGRSIADLLRVARAMGPPNPGAWAV